MFQLPGFVIHSPELQEEIKTEIVWSLHLDLLIGKTAPRAICTALETLPTGTNTYDRAYEGMMEQIEGQVEDQKRLAKQVLSWIICAKRPLIMLEIQHVLAIEPSDTELGEDNLAEVEDMVFVYAGLVTVDKEGKIIRLAHYTMQEYFERTQKRWFPDAETKITETCVTYLLFNSFNGGYCHTDSKFEERLHLYKLYDYAAHNWGHHAQAALTLCQGIIKFLKEQAQVKASSQALMAVKQ
ncbi:hypothetical protein B0J14DRAFT_663208 [Halenospora varia]|nr:hypothetical protein B0J14DRAFT_663208 [Halenospora varia]